MHSTNYVTVAFKNYFCLRVWSRCQLESNHVTNKKNMIIVSLIAIAVRINSDAGLVRTVDDTEAAMVATPHPIA